MKGARLLEKGSLVYIEANEYYDNCRRATQLNGQAFLFYREKLLHSPFYKEPSSRPSSKSSSTCRFIIKWLLIQKNV